MMWQEKFKTEYKKAYKGILPDEVLAEGNKWFEDFIQTELEELAREIMKVFDIYAYSADKDKIINILEKRGIKIKARKIDSAK